MYLGDVHKLAQALEELRELEAREPLRTQRARKRALWSQKDRQVNLLALLAALPTASRAWLALLDGLAALPSAERSERGERSPSKPPLEVLTPRVPLGPPTFSVFESLPHRESLAA